MKKQFFYILIFLVSTSTLLSQGLSDELRALYAKDPANASANFQAHLQNKVRTAPIVQRAEIMLTDSVYRSDWNNNDWETMQKELRTYNCETGDLEQSIYQVKDVLTGMLVNNSKIEYTYHSAGKENEQLRYIYDDLLSEWIQISYRKKDIEGRSLESWDRAWSTTDHALVFGSRSVNQYNASYLLQQTDEYTLDINSDTWLPDRRTIYAYNASNFEISQTVEVYNSNGNWELERVIASTYNSSGKLDTRILDIYSSGVVSLTRKETFFYLANGDLSKIVYEVFDNNTSSFIQTSQSDYTYNAQQDVESILSSNVVNGQLVNGFLSEYTFYPGGSEKTYHHQEWDIDDNMWVTIQKDSNDINGNNLFYQLMFTYDPSLNVYEFGFRLSYNYDGSLLLDYIAQRIELFSFDNWVNDFQTFYTYENDEQVFEILNLDWDMATNNWVNDYLYHYYNTGCLFNRADEPEAQVNTCLFANPISKGKTISCPDLIMEKDYSLEIYTMDGSRVYQENFNGLDQPVFNATLPSGMYLMLIRGGKAILFRDKVVVGNY